MYEKCLRIINFMCSFSQVTITKLQNKFGWFPYCYCYKSRLLTKPWNFLKTHHDWNFRIVAVTLTQNIYSVKNYANMCHSYAWRVFQNQLSLWPMENYTAQGLLKQNQDWICEHNTVLYTRQIPLKVRSFGVHTLILLVLLELNDSVPHCCFSKCYLHQ